METVFETLEFNAVRERLAAHAVSDIGKEFVRKIKPLQNPRQVESNLQQTTECRDLIDYDQAPPLGNIPEIRKHLKHAAIENSMLSSEECGQIGQFCAVVRNCTTYFSTREEQTPALKAVYKRLEPVQDLEKAIFKCVDVNSYELRPDASPELASIRRQIDRARQAARGKVERLLKTYGSKGMLQENVISIRNGRYTLVVKDEYKRKIRGLIHDQSASGASLFIEPLDVLEDNNRIRELQAEERKEIERILRSLTTTIREYQSLLDDNVHTLAILDFICAKAFFSRSLNAFAPEISRDNVISIAQGRHPLLVLRMGEKNVVPLDITLNKDRHTLIISGPNAGGKTVALKTVGLLAMMAQSGLHIPAQPHSKMGVLNHVFASIGDQQSLENDLSTFSSHLEDLKRIISGADDRSLVLIDEIGSGTDPEEGSALAMALLRHLNNTGCFSIVTTHQSPLKAFAYRTKGAENASLEFDVQSLQSTFQFRTGVPGSSYAFEIAQRLGLPEYIIHGAREFVGAQKDRLEGLILELDEKMQEHTKHAREAREAETKYKALLADYEKRFEALKAEKNQIKQKAVREAEQLLAESNAAIERAVRDIRESQASKESIKAAKNAVLAQRKAVDEHKIQDEVATVEETEELQVGDTVRWIKTNGQGTILEGPDKKDRVLVQFEGGVKSQLPMNQLQKFKLKSRPRGSVRVNMDRGQRTSNYEIDLRGMLGDDAVRSTEMFLDEALLGGLHEVNVIHGKGTGALRDRVAQYLKKHPFVESFRMGSYNEGDAGVTVVTLKSKG